jgi:hypothetical protein
MGDPFEWYDTNKLSEMYLHVRLRFSDLSSRNKRSNEIAWFIFTIVNFHFIYYFMQGSVTRLVPAWQVDKFPIDPHLMYRWISSKGYNSNRLRLFGLTGHAFSPSKYEFQVKFVRVYDIQAPFCVRPFRLSLRNECDTTQDRWQI